MRTSTPRRERFRKRRVQSIGIASTIRNQTAPSKMSPKRPGCRAALAMAWESPWVTMTTIGYEDHICYGLYGGEPSSITTTATERFTDITDFTAGVGGSGFSPAAAIWVDLDNDGVALDLAEGREVRCRGSSPTSGAATPRSRCCGSICHPVLFHPSRFWRTTATALGSTTSSHKRSGCRNPPRAWASRSPTTIVTATSICTSPAIPGPSFSAAQQREWNVRRNGPRGGVRTRWRWPHLRGHGRGFRRLQQRRLA